LFQELDSTLELLNDLHSIFFNLVQLIISFVLRKYHLLENQINRHFLIGHWSCWPTWHWMLTKVDQVHKLQWQQQWQLRSLREL